MSDMLQEDAHSMTYDLSLVSSMSLDSVPITYAVFDFHGMHKR